MDIKIKMTNTKISDKVNVISNMSVSDIGDINVEMDGVEINGDAEVLNNLTDTQIYKLLDQLKEQTKFLKETDKEYKEIKNLLADVQKSKLSAREVLKQYLPNLLTGTLANILGNITIK